MNCSGIDAINKLNISGVNIFDSSVNVLFMYAHSGENCDPQGYKSNNHTYFEIHCVIQGTMLYELEGKEIEVPQNHYVIVTPRCTHRVINHSEDYKKLTMSFEVDEENEIYSILVKSKKKFYEISDDMNESINFIFRHANRRGAFYEVLVKKRINEMIYLIANSLAPSRKTEEKRFFFDDRLLKAEKYIKDNPNVFFRCREVAEYCGLSAKQLGRLFKKYRNESMLEFIHIQKISDARKQLLDSDELQETISKNLGFSSVHYFNKFFLNKVGMTPDEYRKKYGKISSRRKKND